MMMSSDLCLSEMNSVACHGPEVVSPSVNKVQKVGEDNAKQAVMFSAFQTYMKSW